MTSVASEAQVLELIAPRLEAEGYDVYIRPSQRLLPPFMQDYIPDAIALGAPKNLAIEIVVEGPSADRKVQRLRELFKQAKDWDFRIYYARPRSGQAALKPAPQATIESNLAAVEKMVAEDLLSPALLMGWATFEALARGILPGKLGRPQSPDRLIEVLAGDGHVTPSEADRLRRLAKARNRIVHGDLEARVTAKDLSHLIKILKDLVVQIPVRSHGAAQPEQ